MDPHDIQMEDVSKNPKGATPTPPKNSSSSNAAAAAASAAASGAIVESGGVSFVRIERLQDTGAVNVSDIAKLKAAGYATTTAVLGVPPSEALWP